MTGPGSYFQNSPTSAFSAVDAIKRNWGWFLTLGIVLVVLGFLAIAAAAYTSLVTIVVLGCLFFVGGLVKLVYSFWAREWNGFLLSLLGGLLYAVVGLLMLAKPLSALAALTLLVGALFLVSGVFKIIASIVLRFEHWGWMLFSGIISLILGGMILAEWPVSSLWVIGLFVGIDMVFFGWTYIILALGARQAD